MTNSFFAPVNLIINLDDCDALIPDDDDDDIATDPEDQPVLHFCPACGNPYIRTRSEQTRCRICGILKDSIPRWVFQLTEAHD